MRATNEEAWLRGVLNEVATVEPAWEAFFAEVQDWDAWWVPNAIADSQKLRLEIAVGEEFTKNELSKRGMDTINYDWVLRLLERLGIVRLVKKKDFWRWRKGADKKRLSANDLRRVGNETAKRSQGCF